MLQDEIKPKEDRIEVIWVFRHHLVVSLCSGYEAADPGHGAGADKEREGPGREPGDDRGHQVEVGYQQFRALGWPAKDWSAADKLFKVNPHHRSTIFQIESSLCRLLKELEALQPVLGDIKQLKEVGKIVLPKLKCNI